MFPLIYMKVPESLVEIPNKVQHTISIIIMEFYHQTINDNGPPTMNPPSHLWTWQCS